MWKFLAVALEVIVRIAGWYAEKQKETIQGGRQDIVDGNVDAVSARIDRLLTEARDRAERGKDS